jgi:hypothetical protein
VAVPLASVQRRFNRRKTDEKGLMKSAVADVEDTALYREWQPLWFSLLTRPWDSLAIIGSDTSTDVNQVADILATVGNREGERRVRVVSALAATAPEVHGIVKGLSDASILGELTLVPCDPLRVNPAMLPILQATSGVVLVVRLGESRLASTKKTVGIVRRDRVFATVAIG